MKHIEQQRDFQIDLLCVQAPLPCCCLPGPAALSCVQQYFYQHKHRIQHQRHVAEVQPADGRNAEGDRNDWRNTKSDLCVERQPQRQHQQADDIK